MLTSLLSLVKMLSTLSDCTIKDIISFSTFQRHPIRNKVRRLNYSVDAEYYSHCYQVKIRVVAYNEENKTLGALKNIHFINSFKIFTALRSSYSSVRRTLLIFLNSEKKFIVPLRTVFMVDCSYLFFCKRALPRITQCRQSTRIQTMRTLILSKNNGSYL